MGKFSRRPPTEETKRKISQSLKGKTLSSETKEKMRISHPKEKNPVYRPEVKEKIRLSKLGKKRPPFSEECKEKMRVSHLGKTGSRATAWRGGRTKQNCIIRSSTDYSVWRKACLERDNFMCQKTGYSGGELHVHHINNFSEFPEYRFDINNGVTLSKEAHNDFHNKYGKKNNTLEQLLEFLDYKTK